MADHKHINSELNALKYDFDAYFKKRLKDLENASSKFNEYCNEIGFEVLKHYEMFQDHDRMDVYTFDKNIKVNINFTGIENKYLYTVYVCHTPMNALYLNHLIKKNFEKERKIRYFFNVKHATLYLKYLNGEKMCWSISKNVFKRCSFHIKKFILKNITFLFTFLQIR